MTEQYPVNRPIFYTAEISPFVGAAGQSLSMSIQCKERTKFLCTSASLIQCKEAGSANPTVIVSNTDLVIPMRLSNVSLAGVYDISNNVVPTVSSNIGGTLHYGYTWPAYILLHGLQKLNVDIQNNYVGAVAYSITFSGIEYVI